jgi:LmbE family N-acetylglucosaminyl deacetylase
MAAPYRAHQKVAAMKLPERILFVGAHCDDIELIAGGLLMRACRGNHRIGVLAFSDHRGVISDALADQARAEFTANVAWLSAETGASIENHTDRWLRACRGDFEAERGYLYERLESLREHYDLVVTHDVGDTNQDHRQVATEAVRALKAHCSLLHGEFPNNDLGTFEPRVYVALDETDIDAKVRLVGAYRSQQFGGRPYFDETVVRGLASVRGAQIRADAAEAFAISRLTLES